MKFRARKITFLTMMKIWPYAFKKSCWTKCLNLKKNLLQKRLQSRNFHQLILIQSNHHSIQSNRHSNQDIQNLHLGPFQIPMDHLDHSQIGYKHGTALALSELK